MRLGSQPNHEFGDASPSWIIVQHWWLHCKLQEGWSGARSEQVPTGEPAYGRPRSTRRPGRLSETASGLRRQSTGPLRSLWTKQGVLPVSRHRRQRSDRRSSRHLCVLWQRSRREGAPAHPGLQGGDAGRVRLVRLGRRRARCGGPARGVRGIGASSVGRSGSPGQHHVDTLALSVPREGKARERSMSAQTSARRIAALTRGLHQ